MRDPRTIFIATDLSRAADDALRAGAERAPAGAKVVVCHVIPRFTAASGPPEDGPPPLQFLELRRRVSEELVRRTVSVTGRKAEEIEFVIEDGNPYAAIVARAEEREADLIVIGSQGSTGLARVLLGSVADKVIRYAHCPVLVVRPSPGTRRILAATDLSEPSLPAIGAAAHEARRTHAALTVLHCCESTVVFPSFDPAGSWPSVADQAKESEILREQAEASMAEALARNEVKGERRVVSGPPVESILSVCEELRPDLVVVGTRGRTGLKRVLLGSVAEAVARLAPCSVLIVRLGSTA